MSDPRPVDQERLWRVLRAAEPPDGAAERVREQVEGSLERRPRRRVAIAVSVAVAAAAAALLVAVRGGDVEIRPAPRVVSAASARQDGRTIVAGQSLGSGAVQVAGGGNLRIALDRAEVAVAGPAAVELGPRGLFVREGRVEIRGVTRVAGPACEAEVSGRAAVEVQRSHVQVTVFAGSASVAKSQVACTVIDLTRPGSGQTQSAPPAPETGAGAGRTQSAQPAGAPATAGALSAPPADPASPPADTALAGQVDAYWAAERLRASDPAAALARFEALQARWPRSPLRPEIDLAIIDLHVQLGRTDAARARARQFLRRYPDSPRRDDVRRIEMRQ